PAQLDLAPASPRRGCAQRGDEVSGLAAEALLPLCERPHLFPDRAVGLTARLLELIDLAVDLLERLGDRHHELLDRLAALVEVLARLHLEALECRPRQLQERRAVRPERLGRERLERRRQL